MIMADHPPIPALHLTGENSQISESGKNAKNTQKSKTINLPALNPEALSAILMRFCPAEEIPPRAAGKGS
jgi:hypothetical protein